MPERSWREQEECIRRKVGARARRNRVPPDDHRLEWVCAQAIAFQRDGMYVDDAIAHAWDLAFPRPLPHPRRGTRWQRRIRRSPGVPLRYGKPERG